MNKKSIIFFMLCGLLNSSVVSAEYDAGELHRLFTDKKQRAQIDAARSGNVKSKSDPVTEQVKVSGYLKRSHGKDVVWFNDDSTLEGNRKGNVRVRQSDIGSNKRVSISVDGRIVRLKPGETWHKESGKIVDSVSR